MFFRGSLDKLGIYPDIYQIGKYKSAGDMFTQKEMTEAHREYINSLLDDLYGRYVDAIAKARGKSADDVKKLIDNAPYNARQAKDAGLDRRRYVSRRSREGTQEAARLHREATSCAWSELSTIERFRKSRWA